MISAAELASIQRDVSALSLDQVCEIQRKSSSRDVFGSDVDVWNTIATVNAGLTEPTAGELQNYDYLIGDKAAWTVKMTLDTDVMHNDHLIIQDQTLEVHVILTPRSYAVLLSVIAAEIK